MNLSLNLRTIIPLITLMSGVLLPTNIALAASPAPTHEASTKQETVKHEKQKAENHTTSAIPQLFFSKKAQKIELIIFFSIIFLCIVVPEVFYKPKKSSQSPKSGERHQKKLEKTKKIEPDIVSLEVIHENTKASTLKADNSKKINNSDKIESQNQSKQEQTIA